MVHRTDVAKLLETESEFVSQITGNNMYPIVNKEREAITYQSLLKDCVF